MNRSRSRSGAGRRRASTSMMAGGALLMIAGGCGGGSSPSPVGAPDLVGSTSAALTTPSATTGAKYSYAFDNTGLVTSVADGTATRAIARTGALLTAGTNTWRFDPLGRTVAIDDLALVYGADGQIASATRGADTTSWLYDEAGDRILKAKNGTPTDAFVDGMHVTATTLDEPARVNHHTVGIVRNGSFVLTATDVRGTVLADTNGTSRLPSPFGDRAVRPDVAATTDFADKAFDDVLGGDRMGVRDYDPRIARFLQPDLSFLLDPSKCVGSPAECNLYGYAKGSPITHVDPTGNSAKDILYYLKPELPDLMSINLSTIVGNVSFTVGTRGDNAGTMYLSVSKAPQLLNLDTYKGALKSVGFSVMFQTLIPVGGEGNRATSEHVDSFATGNSLSASACYGGCLGTTWSPDARRWSVDTGFGVGWKEEADGTRGFNDAIKGASAGAGHTWRLGNPTDRIANGAFKLFHPNARGDTPAEKDYAAEHGPATLPSFPTIGK